MRLVLQSAMIVVVLALFLFAAPSASAANACVSNATGLWSATGTWTTCGGVVPTAADTVQIRGGFTVTVDVSNAAAASMQVGGNPGTLAGTLVFNSGSQVTVTGSVTVGGTTSTTHGTITMTSGGTLIAGSLALGTGTNTKTWTPGTGTLQLTGTNTIPATIFTSFNNLTITALTTTLGASIPINGTLTQSGGNIAVGSFTLTVNGTHNAGTNTVSGAGGYALASAATLQSGSTTGVDGNILTTTKTLNTGANYTFNGSSAQVTGAAMPATVTNITINNAAGVTLTQTTTVSGSLTVTAGTLTVGAFALSVTGATAVSGTLNITSTTGTKTFTGNVTINSGGTWNETVGAAISFGGNLQNDGTLTDGGGTHTFTGTTKTFSGANAISIANLAVTGTYTNNGTLTVGTALSGVGSLTNGPTGTLNLGGTSAITTLTATASGNTVNFNGAAQTVNNINYYHLTLSISGAKTLQTSTTTISGNLTLSGTVAATTVIALTISGNLTVGSGTTCTVAGFDNTVTGTTTVAGTLTHNNTTGVKTFTGNVTINNGGTWNETAGVAVSFGGSLQNDGTFTAGIGVHVFTGTAKTISGANAIAIPSLTISGPTTNNGTLTVATTLAGASTLTNGTNATLNFGGSSISPTLTATATGNSVNYTQAGAQTVQGTTYYNLTLSGSGTKPTTSVTVNGTLSMQGTATASAAPTYGASAMLEYKGSAMQTSGPELLATMARNVIINNAAGVTLGANATVNGILTFTSGKVTTGAFTLYIGSGGSVSRTSGHVVGSLKKFIATGVTSKTFEVGDASNYTPVSVSFASVTTAGDLTASVVSGDHANIGTSNIDPALSVNRNWTLTNSGIVFTTYSATFNFVAGDVDDGGSSAFFVGNYSGGSWTYPTVGMVSSFSTQVTGLTTFSDFQLGTSFGTISGHIQDGSSINMSGVTVTLSGGQAATTTTNASGNYIFSRLHTGVSYTVIPAKTSYSFSPTQQVSTLNGSWTANFTGTFQTYSISVTVRDWPSTVLMSGVTLSLSGGQTATTTTDATGKFTFTNLPSDLGYTVTPSKTGYYFDVYTTLALHGNLGITRYGQALYTMSGHIQNASSVAISGVTVTMSGDQSSSTTTDASGNYSFANLLATNNLTVTPSLTNYTFSAASLTYNNLSSDQTAADFTATSAITYTISGHIQNGSAAAISGVTVTLSGGQSGSTSTDASGNYSFAGLPSINNYTITPSSGSYVFTATSLTYNNLSANQTTADFTTHPIDTTNVALAANGGIASASSTTPDSAFPGAEFHASAVNDGDTAGYTQPHSGIWRDYTDNTFPDWIEVDFNGTKSIDEIDVFSVEDNIATGGTPLAPTPMMTFSLIGLTSFNVQYWNGTTWATVPGGSVSGNNLIWRRFSFSPITTTKIRVLINDTSDHTNSRLVELEAYGTTAAVAAISGHIQNTSTVAISGVTVTLSGGQAGSTTTDASGNYSFTSLLLTSNYTVTPTKTSYAFSPTSRTYNNLSATQGSADFTGRPVPNVTLTASVSPTGIVQPRTDLVYTISFTNGGAGSASAFVITDPIPTNTDFKLGSMTTSLGTTGLTSTLAYSNDAGATWTYTPSSAAGGAPAGYDRNVTHVRWSFAGALSQTSPDNMGAVLLTVRIK